MADAKIILSAVDQTKAAFESAKKNMAGLGEQAEGIKKSLLGLTGTLVGIGSVAAFKSMVDGVISTKVELYKLSVQTGATVESLSAISAVAKLNGIDIASVGSAMNKLQKSLATGTEESKGAAQALEALGLNFDRFIRLSPDAQMLAIAKSMAQFADGGGKSAAAMMLFGKTGAELLPMLKDLAEKNELHGKQSTESAFQAQEYTKNIKQLEAAGNAWKREIVDGMLPALDKVSTAMVKARKDGSGLLGSLWAGIKAGWGGDAQSNSDQAITEAVERMQNLQNAVSGFRAQGFGEDSKVLQTAKSQLAETQKVISDIMATRAALDAAQTVAVSAPTKQLLIKARPTAGGAASTVESDYDKLNKRAQEHMSLLDAELDTTLKLTEAEKWLAKYTADVGMAKTSELNKKSLLIAGEVIAAKAQELTIREWNAKLLEQENKEQEKQNELLQHYTEALQATISDLSFEASLLGKTADEQRKLTALRRIDAEERKTLGALGDDPNRRADVSAQAEEMRKRTLAGLDELTLKQTSWQTGAKTALNEYTDSVNHMADQTKGAVTRAFGAMEDSLVDFVKTGKLDFASLADSIISDLVRIAIRQSITGPLASMFGFGQGDAFDAGAMGGETFAKGGAFTNQVITQPTPFLFANGGALGLMGEAGPEAIMPLKRGPDGSLGVRAAGSGAQNITINIPVQVGDIASKADVVAGMRATASSIVAQLNRSRSYGGVMA